MPELNPAELIEAHQQRLDAQQELPENVTALALLQMVYRGAVKVSAQQMRAAIEALPYENPKLSACSTGDGLYDPRWAARWTLVL